MGPQARARSSHHRAAAGSGARALGLCQLRRAFPSCPLLAPERTSARPLSLVAIGAYPPALRSSTHEARDHPDHRAGGSPLSTACLIDTETTGFDEPDVIELAWMGPLHVFSPPDAGIEKMRFRPRKPISLGAMAVHHILDEDLAGEPEWPGSWTPPADYIVAHSVDYDWKAIGQPNVKRICTLALSRRLWPDLDSHSLSALTYHFTDRREARELLKGAHGAATDVELCCRVLCQILRAMPK